MTHAINSSPVIPDTLSSYNPSQSAESMYRVLKKNIYYHGTSERSAQDISRHGFSLKRKKGGATAVLRKEYGLDDPSAKKYHYVMGIKSAARYAKCHDEPAIIPLIVPSYVQLMKDPQAHADDEYMTSSDIPDFCILPFTKMKPNYENIDKISKSFGVELSSNDVCWLVNKIYKRVICKIEHEKPALFRSVTDFRSAEAQRDKYTKQLLSQQGVDLSNLQEGDTFSLPCD